RCTIRINGVLWVLFLKSFDQIVLVLFLSLFYHPLYLFVVIVFYFFKRRILENLRIHLLSCYGIRHFFVGYSLSIFLLYGYIILILREQAAVPIISLLCRYKPLVSLYFYRGFYVVKV